MISIAARDPSALTYSIDRTQATATAEESGGCTMTAERYEVAKAQLAEIAVTEATQSAPQVATNEQTPADIFLQLDNAIPPGENEDTSDIITVVIDEQHLLGKNFKLMPDGTIAKQSAVAVARGIACQYWVPDLGTLEEVLRIVSDNTHAAIINAGWKHVAIGEKFVFLSVKRLKTMELDREAVTTVDGMRAFARLKNHSKPSTWQLLDRDEDKFTPEWATGQSFTEWRLNLDKILPGIGSVKMLRANSSSARVLQESGVAVGEGNGHVWIKVTNAADTERTRTAILARALEYELAWPKPRIARSTGQECGRSFTTIVDPSVWTTGRLVFVGQPTCSPGLTVAPQQFTHIDGKDDALDASKAVVSPLKTYRASQRQGAPLRLKKNGTGYRSVVSNLNLDTEIELGNGSVKTVRNLMLNLTGKIRCQTPFRESDSMAAFIALDGNGAPFLIDSGTDTRHVLARPTICNKGDKDREVLIDEVRFRLGNLIGVENADAVFDETVLGSAWESSFSTPTNHKFVVINPKNDIADLSVGDALHFGFRRTFGHVFNDDMLNEIILEKALLLPDENKLRKAVAWVEYGPLIERLKLLKQAKSLAVSVDMFAKRGSLSVADGVATIYLPHRRFEAKVHHPKSVVSQVVSDYHQHFPEFPEFLNLVLHARFATDRRHAFVWLHSPSSWGKGFLLAIFEQLGLVVEVPAAEIEKAMAGGPVGLSLIDLLRSWILFVDEFKAASSELKLLNRQIAISPKNQLRCSVQLYTKLFASAESVRSLVGDGVEAQFNNRFAYLAPSTHDQKLEDRLLYKELGKAVYLGAMGGYVADYLNNGVDRLCAMGAIESSKVADNFIESYQSERRLHKTFGNIDEAVDDIVAEIRNCLIQYARWNQFGIPNAAPPDVVAGIGSQLLNTLKRTAIVGDVSRGDSSKERFSGIVLGEPVPFVKSYLALSGDRSTVGKMQYKADEIAAKLNMRPGSGEERVRVYDSTGVCIGQKRGIVVFVDDKLVGGEARPPPWTGDYVS